MHSFNSLASLCLNLLAQAGTESAEKTAPLIPKAAPLFNMDNIFYITIIFVFAAALVSFIIQRWALDRCLKHFSNFNVSVEQEDRDPIWGELTVYPGGIEIIYSEARSDDTGNTETSYILFEEQMNKVTAIERYHEELDDEDKARRLADVNSLKKRGFFKKLGRMLRNLSNAFKDAISQAMGLIVAQTRGKASSSMAKSQDAGIKKIGDETLGAVGNRFEPILERYIGAKVIVEAKNGEDLLRHEGILKEYSSNWLELLECREKHETYFLVSDSERLRLNRDIDFFLKWIPGKKKGRRKFKSIFHCRIRNFGDSAIRICRLEKGEYSHKLDIEIEPGGDADFEVKNLPPELFSENIQPEIEHTMVLESPHRGEHQEAVESWLPEVNLIIEGERVLDLCLPRSRAILRHGGQSA